MTDAWEPLLDRYLIHAASHYESVHLPPTMDPATPEQLHFLRSEGRLQNLFIDPSIERLLARVNGVAFDGLWFYGIQIQQEDIIGRMDLYYMNLLIEERGQDTLYGQWCDELFVHVAAAGTFARRSMAGWRPYFEYDTCNEMIAAIFEEALDYLD